MSRGYSKGGGFPIIIAVIGTVIVVVIGIFIFAKVTDSPMLGGTKKDTETAIPITSTQISESTPTPTAKATVAVSTPAQATLPNVSDTTAAVVTTVAVITPPPTYSGATIWANKLKVRSSPDLNSSVIGSLRYGESATVVEEKTKWLKIQYEGGYGWVWRDFCVRGNASVPAAPTDTPFYLIESMTLQSGSTTTSYSVKVKFTTGVYSGSDGTGAITIGAFSVKDGTFVSINNNAADTEYVILTITPTTASADVKVSVKSKSIYNGAGVASDAQSKTISYTAPTAAPVPTYKGSGVITTSNVIHTSSSVTLLDVSQSGSMITTIVKLKETATESISYELEFKVYNATGTERTIYMNGSFASGKLANDTETISKEFGEYKYGSKEQTN